MFAAILLPALLILAGVLVDVSRISAGKAIVKRAVDTAAKALLADYGSRLKDDYGIFAITVNDQAGLQDCFEENLTCNLSIPAGEDFYKGSADLFGFRIERISVTPVFNLSENDVTKKQILEYMKYRAPAELVEGFVEKLSAVKDVGKMSGAYKQKVGIDKLLGKMDKSQQKLKKLVDGLGSSAEKFINGFNMNGSWESAFKSFNSLKDAMTSAKNSLSSVESNISELESQISQLESTGSESSPGTETGGSAGNASGSGTGDTGSGSDSSSGSDSGSALDALESALSSLMEERSSLEDSIDDTEDEMSDVFDQLRNSLTQDFIGKNEDAVIEVEAIAEKGRKAQEAIKGLEGYLSENFTGEAGAFSTDFRERTQSELDGLKQLILDGQKAAEILEDVRSNSSLLKDVASQLDSARQGTGYIGDIILPPGLLDTIKGYYKVDYDYFRPARDGEKEDPREGKAEAVRKFITEKLLQDVNYETAGISKNDLPSVTKKPTPSFDKEDEELLGLGKKGGSVPEASGGSVEYGGCLGNIGEEADLYNEDGMFQENVLGFVSDIGKRMGEDLTALRDNIYINEYIMGSFKNAVPELKSGSGTEKDINLHGNEKGKIDTFYDGEAEYILHGQPSQKLNSIMTKGEVLLVRFGLDTLHVYTDPKKKSMATGVATAVAGWWTGGAGIPILSNLIMCGWGMGEAIIDITDLMQGESVPIYKMKGDWKLDIGIPAQTGPNTDKRLYFNYHDYLRLFLLTVDENKKLDRIEDLIQLNLEKSRGSFRMTDSSTYVRVEAEISMKYLFITRPFISKALKTADGRYLFKVLVYEGY